MRVLFHHTAGPWLRGRLEALLDEGIDVTVVAPTDRRGLHAALAETEVIWHVLEPLGRADIERAPRLRLIQKIGVGVNTIDVAAASERGIAVCNMPGTNSRAVAEMTLALLLASLRRLMPIAALGDRERWWEVPPNVAEKPVELAGRTVGLVGYGQVPAILAPILRAMGATVLYTATAPKPAADGEWRALDELLEESDVVSLHVPLTEATRGLLDRRRVQAMRPGAVLVNTSRGEVVDQEALIAALSTGHIAAAGLDVFADEPLPSDHPLLTMPTVVCTPHIAWRTRETMERSLVVAVENCRRVARGAPLEHQVNRM